MMRATKTVADEWRDYLEQVLSRDAGPVQVKETRRAFYGGALSALSLMLQVSADEVSEDAGAAILEGLLQECRAFVARVGKDM